MSLLCAKWLIRLIAAKRNISLKWWYPRHPKSSKYLVSRYLETLKAFKTEMFGGSNTSSTGGPGCLGIGPYPWSIKLNPWPPQISTHVYKPKNNRRQITCHALIRYPWIFGHFYIFMGESPPFPRGNTSTFMVEFQTTMWSFTSNKNSSFASGRLNSIQTIWLPIPPIWLPIPPIWLPIPPIWLPIPPIWPPIPPIWPPIPPIWPHQTIPQVTSQLVSSTFRLRWRTFVTNCYWLEDATGGSSNEVFLSNCIAGFIWRSLTNLWAILMWQLELAKKNHKHKFEI